MPTSFSGPQASDNAVHHFPVPDRFLTVKILPPARKTRKAHCVENRIDGEQKCSRVLDRAPGRDAGIGRVASRFQKKLFEPGEGDFDATCEYMQPVWRLRGPHPGAAGAPSRQTTSTPAGVAMPSSHVPSLTKRGGAFTPPGQDNRIAQDLVSTS